MELRDRYPDTIVVSGGADGVDKWAEARWLELGGRVESYRVWVISEEEFGVERWELGGDMPRIVRLIEEPSWADYVSALNYRDILIAEACDRLAVFYKQGRSRGAGFTAEVTREAYGKPVDEWEAEELGTAA